ncbi:glycoside hydrolase N-terminal domain-containing protein [Luteibacter sp. CQ10]|uniref:glycosyl hydrolase family 95 catalytic domain-containing protein n=1 Tax=Luteibacter sp. CQ10 TaxID=2805821 RepID=UPI0034A28AF8
MKHEDESPSASRRQFLKMSGLAGLLPLMGMPVFSACAAVSRPTAPLPPGSNKLALWYPTPSSEANVLREGLPIGNGRIGALVGGDPLRDFLYVTDGSMWLGGRNAVLDEKGQFGYATTDFGSLVMLAKLYLQVDGHDIAGLEDFRRELDMARGVVRMSYRKGGVRYLREVYASHPDDVIVVRLSQDGGGRYSGVLDLQGAHGEIARTEGRVPSRLFDGKFDNGLKYAAVARIEASGGTVRGTADGLHFKDCDALTVIFCGGTNYVPDARRNYMDGTVDPAARALSKIEAALEPSPDALLRTHVADHARLFDTMHVDLGESTPEQRSLDTWARLQARSQATSAPDPELEASYLQFGRYLTIAGSRDKLPTGLQGLWLSDNAPPWMGDYHTDINIQMNYWLPDRAALSSCFDALTEYCLSQIDSWTALTRQLFNDPRNGFRNSSGKVAGWTVAFSTNIYGGNGWWWHPGASAWLCNNLWQHYEYTQDRRHLERIHPLLKGACEFWEARLIPTRVTDPATGHTREVLIDDADYSPEQGPTDAKGNTYAQELAWDLFGHFRESSVLLGRDADAAARFTALREKLYLPRISEKTGWLEEWMTPDNLGEVTHRHLSPLFGFFPGDRIRVEDSPPELIQAVTRLLTARGMTGFGWGCAWRAICWARLKNADNAYRLLLTNLLPAMNHSNGTTANFFDFYQLDENADAFQIDANYGTPTAMLEMLLYSRPGRIELLPALPKAWRDGSITGLGARGGFQVDMAWRNGKVTALTVRSVGGAKTDVVFDERSHPVSLRAGESKVLL